MRRAFWRCWCVALMCGAWAGAGEAPASDEARLQGTWTGRVVGNAPPNQVTLTVRGNQVEFKGADPEAQFKGKLVLNPATNPKQVDIVVQESPAAKDVGKSFPGIYKLDEDGALTLTASEAGEARPQTFERVNERKVFVFRKAQPGGLGAAPSALGDPTMRSPEQKVLDRMLGTWRSEATMFKSEWNPETSQRTSRFTCARVLGGHFVQENHEDAENTHLMLYTYDVQRKAYRAWSFGAMGMTVEFEGKWDADARSLTWTSPPREGKTLTFQLRFVGDDRSEWSLIVKDDAGKVYLRTEGKHTRVKEWKE